MGEDERLNNDSEEAEGIENVGNPEGEEAEEISSEVIAEEPENNEWDATLEEMTQKMQQLENENKMKEEALRLYFDGEDPAIAAIANAQGKTPEQVAQEFDEKAMVENLIRENEELKRQTIRTAAEVAMRKDLAAVQAIDPTIKDLETLGPTFMNLIATGNVSAEEAYYAAKVKIQKETKIPPGEIGKVNDSAQEKDFFTKAEVDAMSPEEISKNYDKVRKSMSKWK